MKVSTPSRRIFPPDFSTRAFSLIEVLCAVLILGVAMVGLTQGITTALQSHKDSEEQTGAALYAAGLVETLRAQGWLENGDEEGDCGSILANHTWKQSVVSTDIDGLHKVQVLVQDKAGRTVYELETMLFDVPVSRSDSTRDSSRSKNPGRNRRAQ